jgi:hypothetical protein
MEMGTFLDWNNNSTCSHTCSNFRICFGETETLEIIDRKILSEKNPKIILFWIQP